MSGPTLYDYQERAVAAVLRAWESGVQRPAGVAATGAGKTVIGAAVVARWRERNPGRRVLWVANRRELLSQAAGALSVTNGVRVGMVRATLNQTTAPIVTASVQTLIDVNRRRMIRDVGLVVCDEAHFAAAPSWISMLEHFGCYTPGGAVALGITATMSRADKAQLGDIWTEIVFEVPIAQLITPDPETGRVFLTRPTCRRIWVGDLDMSKVRTTAGDYSEHDLGEAIEQSLAPVKIAEAYRRECPTEQGIVFAPTVHSAGVIRDALREEGFAAELVHGKTPDRERTRILNRFREGSVQILCNAMVFTHGTDLPMASVVVIARPTKSNGLYIQMAGRALRLHPGKERALILDMVGVSQRMPFEARIELFGEEIDRNERDEDLVIDPDEQLLLDTLDESDESTMDDSLGALDPEYAEGQLRAATVDLFATSNPFMWRRTRYGVMYLDAQTRFIVILPGVELFTYDVVSVPRVMGDGFWVDRGLSSLALAQKTAEEALDRRERRAAGRTTDALTPRAGAVIEAEAARWSIPRYPGMSIGELQSQLSVAIASARIDSALPPYILERMIYAGGVNAAGAHLGSR